MGYLAKTSTMVAALLGAATFSQAPEFAQQYRQRLGGALDELRVIVEDFDHDARGFNLDRQNALSLFSASNKDFIRARGQSMRQTILRYDALSAQAAELNATMPLFKPFVVLSSPDRMIVENAWKDFAPAMPVTVSGGAWAGIGAFLTGCITGLMTRTARRRRPSTPAAI